MTLEKLSEYGPEFQIKILASLLTDKSFASQVRHMTLPNYFDNKAHKWIIEKAITYFDQYNSCITLEALKVEVAKIKKEVLRVAITEQLRKCYKASDEDKEYIQGEFVAFARNQAVKEALLKSVDDLNNGEYDSIRTRLEYALNVGRERDTHHDYKKEVEARYRDDNRNPIPFPWQQFNAITKGGFGAGDLVIFFGNPGGGKSWVMAQIAIHAAKQGYNSVYYTLELGEDYVAKRIDTCLTGIPDEYIEGNVESLTSLKAAIQDLTGEIKVKEFLPKRASVDTIRQHLRFLKETENFQPDFIIIDYLDYLRPSAMVKNMDGKAMIDDSYIGAKALAKEYQFAVISPSQVNRSGAKDDVIEGDKAAGSYDKIMIGDIVYSLSRKTEDKQNKTGRFHQIKNRYGPDAITWFAHVDTHTGEIRIISEGSPEEDVNSVEGKVNLLQKDRVQDFARKAYYKFIEEDNELTKTED